MSSENGIAPDVATLRRLRTLSQFDDAQLESLSRSLTIEVAHKGDLLIPQGCTEDYSFYLLDGDIESRAADGKNRQIKSEPSADLEPIAQLRPSMFDVRAISMVKYLRIYRVQLTEFAQAMMQAVDEGVEIFEFDDSIGDNQLTLQLYEHISSGHLELPSLPDVAMKIQMAFESDTVEANSISRIIQSDPAITAKLIMVANSPLYRGQSATENVNAAVVRLGLESTRKLVLTYAVNDLFKAKSGGMKKRMRELWTHSRRVAAISRVLATLSKRFDPEQAQLAGLLHELGSVAILHYAQEHPELCDDDSKLDETLLSLHAFITGMLLRKWHFSDELVMVAEECDDWFRNHENEPDLCDLVLVAQMHSFIGTRYTGKVPPMTKLPALAKLGLGEIGPNESLKILDQSKDEIKEVEALLSGL